MICSFYLCQAGVPFDRPFPACPVAFGSCPSGSCLPLVHLALDRPFVGLQLAAADPTDHYFEGWDIAVEVVGIVGEEVGMAAEDLGIVGEVVGIAVGEVVSIAVGEVVSIAVGEVVGIAAVVEH